AENHHGGLDADRFEKLAEAERVAEVAQAGGDAGPLPQALGRDQGDDRDRYRHHAEDEPPHVALHATYYTASRCGSDPHSPVTPAKAGIDRPGDATRRDGPRPSPGRPRAIRPNRAAPGRR